MKPTLKTPNSLPLIGLLALGAIMLSSFGHPVFKDSFAQSQLRAPDSC